MMNITISGNTVEEFSQNFGAVAERFGYVAVNKLVAAAAEKKKADDAKGEQTSQQPAAPKPETTGKKKKDEKPVEQTPSAGEQKAAPTTDDCREALRKVMSSKGEAKAREILTKHGTDNCKNLATDKYARFIADCEEAAK